MSASYHMLSAPDAPAPTAMREDAPPRRARDGCVPGASDRPTKRGEHDKRHHPRLEQREIVAGRRHGRRRGEPRCRTSFCAVAHHGSASLFDHRQRVELMERRRRRQGPFQRRGACAPRIVGSPAAALAKACEERRRGRSARRRPRCRSRARTPCSSRQRRRDSRYSGAACRRGRGSAAGRTAG